MFLVYGNVIKNKKQEEKSGYFKGEIQQHNVPNITQFEAMADKNPSQCEPFQTQPRDGNGPD